MKMVRSFFFAKVLTGMSPIHKFLVFEHSKYLIISYLILVFSIIFNKLGENGTLYQQETTSHLSNYAEDGFRTLAFAYRKIETGEYKHWDKIFTQAKTTIGPEREELLEKASEMIEKDLILLGVAAVEDKLQKGVCAAVFLFLCVLCIKGSRMHRQTCPSGAENMAANR